VTYMKPAKEVGIFIGVFERMVTGAQDYGPDEVGIIDVTFIRRNECFTNMERWGNGGRIDLDQLGWSVHRYQMSDQVSDRLGSDKTIMS
jgi:hypothetical protein